MLYEYLSEMSSRAFILLPGTNFCTASHNNKNTHRKHNTCIITIFQIYPIFDLQFRDIINVNLYSNKLYSKNHEYGTKPPIEIPVLFLKYNSIKQA